MKKAGLYCRVSTDIQMEGYSIDAQKDFLKSYCKMHEIDNYEFYIDGGYSGSTGTGTCAWHCPQGHYCREYHDFR